MAPLFFLLPPRPSKSVGTFIWWQRKENEKKLNELELSGFRLETIEMNESGGFLQWKTICVTSSPPHATSKSE